jgi:GntR family transcriptional regulator
MILKIDSSNGVPLYLQIAKGVKHSIAIGSLKPGEQLPSVREIAVRITVNPNTVAKAYRELEAQGIVETRRGTGTFVTDKIIDLAASERRKLVGELMDRTLGEAKHLQLGKKEVMRLFDEKLAIFWAQDQLSQERRDE